MASLFKASAKLILALGLAATCIPSAFAHTYLSSIYLGDQALAEGDCVRSHPSTAFDSPIPLVSQADMTCGWLPWANTPTNRKCPIAAGTKIGLQWHHNSASPNDDIVDPTHVGPLMVYLAKSETGSGNVWFKIYEDGFSNGQWAVDRLLANKGRVDVTIPSDIAPGNYLLRGEILALHASYDLNGVQPYVGCVELTISGSGKAAPAGVAIPGVYKNTDSGMLFDRFQAFTSYPIPGPAVYKSGSASTPSTSGSSTPATSAPTSAPPVAPTTRPTSPPATNPATPSNGNIKVGLNGGTGVWWVGAIVSGGAETTVKVEMMDSGSVRSWVAMSDKGYAYVFSASVQVVLPISLRVTSSTGKQQVLTNVFTSFSTGDNLIDTGKTYSSTPSTPATYAPTSAPTNKPSVTSAPTSAPTNKPTSPPATGGSNAKVTLHSGASEWWFALTVNSADVASVEIKDSGRVTAFTTLVANNWGGSETVYTYTTQGAALVAPISVKVTSKSGKVVTSTVSSITPSAVFESSGSL